MVKKSICVVSKSVDKPPRAAENEETDDSSSISSSSSSEPSNVQTAADSSAPKRWGAAGAERKRHKAAEDGDEGKDTGVNTGHKKPARPSTDSKAKAAAKRHRTARPAKARGPSQQPLSNVCTLAPAPCAHSAFWLPAIARILLPCRAIPSASDFKDVGFPGIAEGFRPLYLVGADRKLVYLGVVVEQSRQIGDRFEPVNTKQFEDLAVDNLVNISTRGPQLIPIHTLSQRPPQWQAQCSSSVQYIHDMAIHCQAGKEMAHVMPLMLGPVFFQEQNNYASSICLIRKKYCLDRLKVECLLHVLGVKEFQKPCRVLNAEVVMFKTFELIKPILSSGLNPHNTVAAINTFAMSQLWYQVPLLQLTPSNCLNMRKKIAAELSNQGLLFQGQSSARLFLPKRYDCLGLIDPSRVPHKMMSKIKDILETTSDPLMQEFLDLTRIGRSRARIKTSFV
ncbi:hypothetical protein HZS_673, partial [Henneguya salminicola]